MTSHVDAETLALSAEGLLDEAESSSVQGHLAQCPECTEQLAALADVPRLLGEAPAPEIPDEVVARIDEALRAEAEQRDTPPGNDTDPSHPPAPEDDTVVSLTRRTSRWLPLLAGAAAAVFIVGGASALLYSMIGPDNGAGQANSSINEQERPDTARSYDPTLIVSGTEYTEDDLDDQATEVLGDLPADAHPGESEDDAAGSGADGADSESSELPDDVSACVQGLDVAEGDAPPALIDSAAFQPNEGSTEDALVMYYNSNPTGGFEVVVVSSDCGDGDPADSVLATTSVETS